MSNSLALRTESRFAAVPAVVPWPARKPAAGLLAHSQPVLHFAADAEIFADGDEAICFYKVMSGVVRTCKFLSDGRRQVDAFYVAGDVFGFEAGAEHQLSAEAVSDCTVAPYRRRSLEAAAAQDESAALQLYTFAMRSLEHARAHCLLLGCSNAMQKLAAFLLNAGGRNAEAIDLAMTRQDIADYLGLTIETVSRTLSQLDRKGVIGMTTARHIELKNRAALLDLAA